LIRGPGDRSQEEERQRRFRGTLHKTCAGVTSEWAGMTQARQSRPAGTPVSHTGLRP